LVLNQVLEVVFMLPHYWVLYDAQLDFFLSQQIIVGHFSFGLLKDLVWKLCVVCWLL
jgi:hypothetical protein